MFNKDVQVHYIFNAHKPSIVNYEKAMELMGTDKMNTIFVGDQLFTDVWGAKRAGIRNILVKPIHPKEEIQIVLKRKLEKIVLYFTREARLSKILSLDNICRHILTGPYLKCLSPLIKKHVQTIKSWTSGFLCEFHKLRLTRIINNV